MDNSVSSHTCIVTLHTYPHLYGYKYNNRYLLHITYIKYSSCLHISLSCDILPRWSLPIGLSYIKYKMPGGAILYRVLCITKAHHNYWNSHDVPLPEKKPFYRILCLFHYSISALAFNLLILTGSGLFILLKLTMPLYGL